MGSILLNQISEKWHRRNFGIKYYHQLGNSQLEVMVFQD